MLHATSVLAEQHRETTIFGIFPLGGAVLLTLLVFTPEGIELNLPEPEYNLPEPEYNLPEPQQQTWTTCLVQIAIFRGLGGVLQI